MAGLHPKPDPQTVHQLLVWAYSNLQRAHAALTNGAHAYTVGHHSIRAKFYKRYREGLSEFGSLIKDHEEKMEAGDHCAYCGADVSLRENRSTDHLIPKSALKLETGDNAVRVCRACNTSKNATDLLAWFAGRPEKFPPLLVFRIYLKLAYAYCERERMLDLPWPDSQRADLPFRMDLLYRELPPLGELRLRVVPC